MKSIEDKHIDDTIEAMETAITKLSDYSITLQQHGLDLQNSEVVKIQYKLKDHIKHLNTLPNVQVNAYLANADDLEVVYLRGKNYGYAEAALFSLTGEKREINTRPEYEGALQDINKEQHLK